MAVKSASASNLNAGRLRKGEIEHVPGKGGNCASADLLPHSRARFERILPRHAVILYSFLSCYSSRKPPRSSSRRRRLVRDLLDRAQDDHGKGHALIQRGGIVSGRAGSLLGWCLGTVLPGDSPHKNAGHRTDEIFGVLGKLALVIVVDQFSCN